MDDSRFKWTNNLLTVMAAVFGLIASIFGGVNTARTSALESELKKSEDARRQTEFELKYRRDIYEEIKAFLKETITEQRVDLVLTLVSALPQGREDQIEFRNRVEKLVKNMTPTENTPEAARVRRQIRDATPDRGIVVSQASLPPEFFQGVETAVVSEKGWDIDIFYCTEVSAEGNNLKLARQAFEHLKAAGDVGRLRVRKLPPAINQLPEYSGKGLMIRADSDATEQTRARRLLTELEQAGVRGGRVEPNTGRSAWYLSAFVCP
jgi:hypothetical protein